MRVLITGGAGFIGRWVTKRFLAENAEVYVYDNLSNGNLENIREFLGEINFINADIRDRSSLERAFRNKFNLCIHAAAQINVQTSIDNPLFNFDVNVVGSENVLDQCHKNSCKIVHISSCMVYDTYTANNGINENHKILPRSPYAASKASTDYNALAYHLTFGDDVTILRPFNTYGPFQRSDTEGGVVSIFVKQNLFGVPLTVFEPGYQSRDLLYVEDCAEFIYLASTSELTNGIVLNAGYDRDVTILELADIIMCDTNNHHNSDVIYVKHPHPKSEISKLLCDSSLAREILRWKPRTELEQGIERVKEWMQSSM